MYDTNAPVLLRSFVKPVAINTVSTKDFEASIYVMIECKVYVLYSIIKWEILKHNKIIFW